MDDARIGIALRFWLDQVGKPYYYGAEGPDEWDCSGLYRQGLIHAGLWPIAGDANVARIFNGREFQAVPWHSRQPGDAVFYGSPETYHPVHMVCALSRDELVGANGGFPPMGYGTAEQEPPDAYRARIHLTPRARVTVTGAGYWASHRLGVVRSSLVRNPRRAPRNG